MTSKGIRVTYVMAIPISNDTYIKLVNAGKVPLKEVATGVYQVGELYAAYKKDEKNKIASIGQLKLTEAEAEKELEIPLETPSQDHASWFRPF